MYYSHNGLVHLEHDIDQSELLKVMATTNNAGAKFTDVRHSFGAVTSNEVLSLHFQNLNPAEFTVSASGITKEGVGGQTEPIIMEPTAPATGEFGEAIIEVRENSNPAGNNAPMTLKILYDHEVKIQAIKLVDGENEQALNPSWYTLEEENRKLTFNGTVPKKALFPITTNLKGVVYDKTEAFEVTIPESTSFNGSPTLRIMDKEGNLIATVSGAELKWTDGQSASAGLYKFELDLTPTGGALQTFKGQFIIPD